STFQAPRSSTFCARIRVSRRCWRVWRSRHPERSTMNDHAVMTLLGIGSVATAISGFSGVVAAFGGRADGTWLPAERVRTTNMLVLSLGACLLSFVPLTEELLRIPDRILWTIASLSLLAFCLFYYVRTIILLRRPSLSRRGVLVEWVRWVYFVCLSLAII